MLYSIAYTIVWPIFRLLFPYKVIGKDKLQQVDGGFVVCGNHISMLDPIYIVFAFSKKHRVHYMAKEELFRNKIFAWFFRGIGAFPVNRGVGSDGLKTAKQLLASGKIIGIFPEGTRSKDGKLGKGKAGAAMVVTAVGGSVLPVSIVTKHQKVRVFRKATIVIGDPVTMPPVGEMSQREYLRVCTKAIMTPIEEGLNQYGK